MNHEDDKEKTVLSLWTKLYNGFGGWMITKDGKTHFIEEPDKEFDENKTLQEIEEEAVKSPNSEWKAVLDLPLRSGVYQRQGKGEWVLIKSGKGFA